MDCHLSYHLLVFVCIALTPGEHPCTMYQGDFEASLHQVIVSAGLATVVVCHLLC